MSGFDRRFDRMFDKMMTNLEGLIGVTDDGSVDPARVRRIKGVSPNELSRVAVSLRSNADDQARSAVKLRALAERLDALATALEGS